MSTISASTNGVLLIACSTIWACVEQTTPVDALRAGDELSNVGPRPLDMGGPPEDPNEQIPPPDQDGCHAIYAQDLLPIFDLTIDPDVWDELEEEWEEGPEKDKNDAKYKFFHPLEEFRYGEIVITDAEIRLRGNADSWDEDDKLQFHIKFDRQDDQGHFLGLKRLAFDAATPNRHMLRDRLALQIMRDMGVTASCANNARLNINGEYYGIFSNLEKIDEIFLERAFDDPSGDLWDRHNWELETNKGTADDARLEALIDAETVEELETHLDLEQALRVFAAEAIIPDSDGMWAGGLNFFVYDEPISGKFVMLPWDMDNTLERFADPPDGDYPVNPDPVVWEKPTTHGRPWYELALSDEEWFYYYIEAIGEQFESGYKLDVLHARIDAWTEQIADSILEDDNKPYSDDEYEEAVEALHEYVDERHEFLVEWLACWADGGEPDEDGYCED